MRYRLHQGQLVPSHLVPREPAKRSHLSAPMLIRDEQDALRNPATGLLYDSKSAFRRATRDAGCYEVGNDAPTTSAGPNLVEPVAAEADVKQAMEELGYAP